MKTIGIVGAGTMGAGIAQAAALGGYDVLIYDTSASAVQRGMDAISSDLRRSLEKGKISPDQSRDLFARIRSSSTLTELSSSDLVIEAILEHLETKQELFRQLESCCTAETTLATNTSSLSVTALASALKHPGRFVGLHFFNPAHVMKLVEIVRGQHTSEEVIRASRLFVEKIGKVSVILNDSPGFIVNRIARPFYGEALRLLAEGMTTVEEIDRIVRLEGGFKMGPFELMDLIGIDVNLAVTKSMYEQTFHEPRYRPHVIQQRMVQAGQLGRKSRRGFYRYDA